MGTSSSGGGGGNRNPLIPSWISGGDAPAPAPPTPPPPPPEAPQDGKEKPDAKPEPKPDGKPEPKPNPPSPPAPQIPNRYTGPRKDFNKFVSSRGSNTGALRKALKGYSRHAAGSSTGMARRMSPAASRVASFVTAINTIRQAGVSVRLKNHECWHPLHCDVSKRAALLLFDMVGYEQPLYLLHQLLL